MLIAAGSATAETLEFRGEHGCDDLIWSQKIVGNGRQCGPSAIDGSYKETDFCKLSDENIKFVFKDHCPDAMTGKLKVIKRDGDYVLVSFGIKKLWAYAAQPQ